MDESKYELQVDVTRQAVVNADVDESVTGIFVRAQNDGRWGSYDIAFLDAESLLKFLRSRGSDNRWAEDVVGILMGHGHLHKRVVAGQAST